MKLITLNIEGDKHWDTVTPFFTHEHADVICLQEVFESDLERVRELGYTCVFAPMTLKQRGHIWLEFGIAICSRYPVYESFHLDYDTGTDRIVRYDHQNKTSTVLSTILISHILCADVEYTIGTTHFTWTADGCRPAEAQAADMARFEEQVLALPPHIMCGDFNIPRHKNPLYETLLKNYTDNIPPLYTSSLDQTLHRLGSDPKRSALFEKYLVDYIFSQSPYKVSNVRLAFGISDHAAVVSDTTKN